ncbi:MAG: phosphotransferase [Pseudomonadales bacterium]|nr:phosphotransferase [Pseudomonadales bacterium]
MTPASAAVAWAREALDAESLESTRLAGGTAGACWRLSGRGRDGRSVRAVLKTAEADDDGAALVAREARVLSALAPLALPVPAALAWDATGAAAGRPALLLGCMPGRLLAGVRELRSAIPAMAATLAQCQREARAVVAGTRFHPWHAGAAVVEPSWSGRGDLWRRAAALLGRFPPPRADAFIHRDPHPANFLFEDGRVTALLDWPHAGRGPAGMDAARMGVNLACLLDPAAAIAFREAFEARRGIRHDPLLDVHAAVEFLPDPDGGDAWGALGVEPTRTEARERLETFLADALRRMTTRRVP